MPPSPSPAYSTDCQECLAGGPTGPSCGCAWWAGDWTWESGRQRRRRGRRVVPAGSARGAGRRLVGQGAAAVRRAAAGTGVQAVRDRAAPVDGFRPDPCTRGTVDSILASSTRWCRAGVCSAPSSCAPTVAGTVWRAVGGSFVRYPWSLLWRAGDSCEHVRALVDPAGSPAGSAEGNPAPVLGLIPPFLDRACYWRR
jgi:hypothetical protein